LFDDSKNEEILEDEKQEEAEELVY